MCPAGFRASMGRMVRTVYYVAASLDGFISDSRDSQEWHRGFSGAEGQDVLFRKFLGRIGALVMGAGTYRSFQAAGPDSWAFGRTPAWVFTHHEFPGISGADITFARGDVAEFHPDIVHDAGGKDIWLVGGGNLAAQFMNKGLVDEVVLTVIPVVLGSGRPLLPVAAPTGPAVLIAANTLGQGLMQLHYGFDSGGDSGGN